MKGNHLSIGVRIIYKPRWVMNLAGRKFLVVWHGISQILQGRMNMVAVGSCAPFFMPLASRFAPQVPYIRIGLQDGSNWRGRDV